MGPDPVWTDDKDFAENLDPVSQEAVTWFATMHADEVTAADRVAFRAWLRRDERHRTAYADVERMWAGASELPVVKARRRAQRLIVSRRTLGKAAIAAVVGGSAWTVYRQHPFADYRTDVGERRMVTLADNSSVEMAASTALSVNFDPHVRLVRLHRGEAFFTVAPGSARPFVVEAAAGRTMAAGTRFNVDYLCDDVRVTVAENAVHVRVGARDQRLESGSQVTYTRGSIGAPRDADPATELAWREGRLIFVSQPFGRVIATLNRWRPGNLVVLGSALAERPVTLIVDLEKAGDILPVLQETLPIRVVRLPYITLISAA